MSLFEASVQDFFKNHIKNLYGLKGVSFFDIVLDSEFSSSSKGYRQKIRQHLVEKYKDRLSLTEQVHLLNLDQLPQTQSFYFSISHCPHIGGYTVSSVPQGFDIEHYERVKPELVQRISSPAEAQSALFAGVDIRYLWSAKEAVVKSFLSRKNVISDFQTVDWAMSQIKTGLWTYRAQTTKTLEPATPFSINKGYVYLENDIFISLFFR